MSVCLWHGVLLQKRSAAKSLLPEKRCGIKANVVSICSSQTFTDCGQGSGMKELYVHPYVHPSSFLSFFLSFCSSVRQSFRPSVRHSFHPSVRPSILSSLCPSVLPSIRPSILLSVINLPIISCPIFRFAYLYFFSFFFGQPCDWPTHYV